jgi:hypothetical protein
MPSASLPYSQSLRTIGQSLEVLGVEAFDLEKEGEDYLVHVTASQPTTDVPFDRTFLKKIVESVWGSSDADKSASDAAANKPSESGKPAESLCYKPSDVSSLDAQGRLRRSAVNAIPDPHKLSQVLRVIGDHLDRKKAGACTISLTSRSASITYETGVGHHERDTFTVDNLYDLAVHMYLRRPKKTRRER